MNKHFRVFTASTFRLIFLYLAMTVMSACTLPSGGGSSPMVWIDRPLDGESFPLAPIILQAHAADSDGITMIEFLVSDSLIGSVTTGGTRLEEASLEWTPPAAGTYTINVRAVDTQGNTNVRAPASVHLTVNGTSTLATGQCAAGALVAPLLLSPADGTSVTGEPLLAWSYPDASCHPYSYAVDISSEVSFADISPGFGTLDYSETSRQWPLPAGQCYYWRVKAYVPDVTGPASPVWSFCITGSTTTAPSSPTFTLLQNANCRLGPGTAYDSVDVIMQGASAAIEGRNQENTWFWVKKPSGNGNCWISSITGTASGDWQAVQVVIAPTLAIAAATPMLPATATPTPADVTPPVISNVTISPLSIMQKGCGGPDTLTVSATVTDNVPSGVANVIYELSGPGPMDGGDGYLIPPGGDYSQSSFQAVVGPIAGSTGVWSMTIQATDMNGNTAQVGPWTFQVVCIQ